MIFLFIKSPLPLYLLVCLGCVQCSMSHAWKMSFSILNSKESLNLFKLFYAFFMSFKFFFGAFV